MARRTTTHPPRIDPIRVIDYKDGDSDRLVAHGRFEALRYVGIDVSGWDLRGASFVDCALSDVAAHEVGLTSAEFADTTIDRLNAPILTAPRSRWQEVSIDHSRIGSAELYNADLHAVHISNSKLGYINLRGAELTDVLFTNCTIDELDLGGARVSRLAFVSSSVSTLDTSRAKLAHVDLRGAELRSLAGLDDLRGTTMTGMQVGELTPLFAERFGITVDD